ncbi:hypothetical protein T4D_5811 [Trichinella pseudospiralis]|uniref:PiggyBac transposable element-derived protein domain-containing protein n=1 Tax=Trichinella pseudospiralis TaxID=6337 RepID=A0A0V1F3X6_TRIPS|nr:hypothetical protein T4D_8941 [Trichinella pseudospiralis]KRY82106.1 hypothetical protein T4D_2119 [Trichinella pseudospiralis]KRY82108.1 hypothetical protein T4D_9389 [Trichinella pseudospiralis]KRY83354.1 hypothetical protein T4D_8133 [Trichinella pseudospiralis]KRY83360.1 hypothetical protein T4D_5811 [Trichinella pseudospiralis]
MRYRKNKKGCKGGLTTNMDVTAVLRWIPHGDDCPMDEETANEKIPPPKLVTVNIMESSDNEFI